MKYLFTAVSGDIDFPEFTIAGLVDEGQFIYFDSNTKKGAKDWFILSIGIISIHKMQSQNTILLLVLECYVLHLAPKSRKSQEKEKEKSLYSMR